jgi:hypothetical protein
MTKAIRMVIGVMGKAKKIPIYQGFTVTGLGQIRNSNTDPPEAD